MTDAAPSPNPAAADPHPTPEKSLWTRKVEAEPEHSKWFLQRFRDMRAAGKDIVGEARLVDAMAARGARILDAGCGSGRIGGPLAALGHTVVGIDVDPVLIDAAKEDFPDVTWLVGDLAGLDPAACWADEKFDIAVAAGNVLPFLAPSTRGTVLANIRGVLVPGGRAVVGFGAGRGYPFDEFLTDAAGAGWQVQATFRGWNLLPFEADSDFLVAVMAPAVAGRSASGYGASGRGASGRSRGAGPTSVTIGRVGSGTAGIDPMGGNSLRPMR